MAKLTEEKLNSRIDYAVNQYSSRDDTVNAMVDLYQQNLSDVEAAVPAPGAKQHADFLKLVKPGRAQAIIEKFDAYLGHSQMSSEVLPLRREAAKKEQQKCSTLEEYIEGLIEEQDYETHNHWYQSFRFWGLLGGLGTLKTLYFADLRGTEEYPIKFFTPDPREIFRVMSAGRPIYVVQKYQRYVMSLREEMENWYLDGEAKIHHMPSFTDESGKAKDDTELVEVVEYWDERQRGFRIDGEWILNTENLYGLIPYAFWDCSPTPINDRNWEARPILASSENALKNEAYLLSMLQTGAEFYFFPQVLVQDENNTALTLRAEPGMMQSLAPNAKVTVLNPLPAVGVLQAMLTSFVAEIARNTLPEMMWGQPPSPARTGYAEEIRFQGTQLTLNLLAKRLSAGLSHAFSNVLRITEKYAGKGGFGVFSMKEGKTRRELINVKASDVDGHYRVRVDLNPILPKDMLKQAQLNRFLAERDPLTQKAQLPQAYRDAHILNVPDPTLVEGQRQQELILNDPKVAEWLRQKAIEDFRKQHGITDGQWEKLGMPEIQEAPGAGKIQLAIPPRDEEMMGVGQGEMPWGLSPEMMPPEMVGRGRAQVYSPEELAELAGTITGRPPEE